ncbi:MAG: hypothetical protein O2855_09345 [Planctomycetota bacterium]|nr:hypothetical protein [Planctomycetota bacterium]
MANIAEGLLYISPLAEREALVIDHALRPYAGAFCNGGEDSAKLDHDGDGAFLCFSGRWTCDAAWDAFDEIMSKAPAVGSAAQILIASEISGHGRESETRYRAKVTKEPGACRLRRFRRP